MKAVAGNNNVFTKPVCAKRGRHTGPAQPFCAALWASVSPPGSVRPKPCGSHWTLPLVIEIVDTEEKTVTFPPVIDAMMSGGLMTLEKASVINERAGAESPEPT